MKKIICLALAALIAVSTAILTGCGGSDTSRGEINVFNWGDYISLGEGGSMNVLDEFEKRTGIKVNYTTYETNEEMYNVLKGSNSSYDVIFPSDYMVSKLIKENMIQPLDFDNIPNFKNIMDKYKTTDYDPEGKYSVPFSWGVVALCYNKTMVDEKPTSFSALWDEKYSGNMAEYLKEQKPLLKSYAMDKVFTEMEGSQSALAPYYAGDIAVMMSNNEELDYVLPEEGSNLFMDAMCIPNSSKNKALAEEFINFMLEPDVSKANIEYLGYSTPNQATFEILDEDIKNNKLIYPDDEYLDKCYKFTDIPSDLYDYMQDQFLKVQS